MNGEGDHIEQIFHGDVFESTIIGKKVEIRSPQAKIHPRGVKENERQGEGSYLTRAILDIEDPYAAQALHVWAYGTSISSLSVVPTPDPTASVQSYSMSNIARATNQVPERAGFKVGAPLGASYQVDVLTTKPDNELRVEVGLES
jgi:hypothetical protein